jgi:hypothetical protein
MDWMSEALTAAESALVSSSTGPSLSFINFNLATPYLPELGFCVAVDGAMRLARPLPAAAIISSSPPGSMYQVGVDAGSVCGGGGEGGCCYGGPFARGGYLLEDSASHTSAVEAVALLLCCCAQYVCADALTAVASAQSVGWHPHRMP